jgi:hypothetical protein
MKRVVLAVVAAVSASCAGIDLVSPSPNAQPTIVVSPVISYRDSAEFRIDAFLTRGTDSHGDPRELIDSALVVDGEAVQPIIDPRTRNFRYVWTGAAAPGSDDTLVVRLPVIVGIPPYSLRFPVPPRPDTQGRDHAEGDALQLRVPLGTRATASANIFWTLDVRKSDGTTVLRLNGNREAPPILQVPWDWLQVSAGDTLHVNFQRSLDFPEIAASYSTRVVLFTQAIWLVAIVAGP